MIKRFLDNFCYWLLWILHKLKRLIFRHPDDGVKFHQLTNLSPSDRELADLLHGPDIFLLFGSKMDVHPKDNQLTVKTEEIGELVGKNFLAFIRHFTNSKGNLLRAEFVLVHESGVVSYSCLNRFSEGWMIYEPTMWSGSDRYYLYLDNPLDLKLLLVRLLGSTEFKLLNKEKLEKFDPDPKAWRFKPLQDYVASLKNSKDEGIHQGVNYVEIFKG